jgi:3-oxoacyl-[acyl-carrier-protein] synthase II
VAPRVVVTGVGAITPVGTGCQALWEGLLSGRCGVGRVRSFDTAKYRVKVGAEVHDDLAGYIRALRGIPLGRTSQLAIAAARLCLDDAGLDLTGWDAGRVGVALGTTSGESRVLEAYTDGFRAGDTDKAAEELGLFYPSHVLAGHVAAELVIEGPNVVLPAACAAGNYALAYAYDTLLAGRADLMLAGGADSFSRITYTGFARLGAIAPERCQPFDRNRKGMIPGEGAAVLTLELADAAQKRGARIYAELMGYGLSCDAHHATSMTPNGEGVVRAMGAALRMAGVEPSEVDYLSAHGTGTPTNDRVETLAIKNLFGEAAYRVPVSSVKSMLGHTMGAAAAIEAAVCALAVRDDRIPPTLHLDTPDPECDLDYVPRRARERRVAVAVNNAYGFGGYNSSLVFKKWE